MNKTQTKELIVAVAGNPNCGKSTLINAIAGSKLHVGNWPGVTVEKKEAAIEFENAIIRFVDLPGCYSLSPYSQEEVIARDFLVHKKPDVILNVVDSTTLERSLNLTLQLLELEIPVVMAMNVMDELESKGAKIDISLLEELLSLPVIPTVAVKKQGIIPLLRTLTKYHEKNKTQPHFHFSEDIEEAVTKAEEYAKSHFSKKAGLFPPHWLALRLLENDREIRESHNMSIDPDSLDHITRHIKKLHSKDIEVFLNEERFALAHGVTTLVLKQTKENRQDMTDKIDKVLLNKWVGIPLFILSMWLLFKLTFDLSTPFVDWADTFVSGPLSRWFTVIMTGLHSPAWLLSLVVDGVIAGVGTVLVFLPTIFAMMFFITILEASGYLARVAFIMDNIMHKMGLHGKSFIPMLLGFGCNVPSVYATRTLESERDKQLTVLLIPLMSCSARLPVYVLFASAFFPHNKGTVIWSLYFLGILLAFVIGALFSRTLFKKHQSREFIMELPPYRMPSFANISSHAWEKSKHFLTKAGTYILAMSVIVWFLFYLPVGAAKKDSYLGKVGAFVSPVFKPLGFGTWQASSALMTGGVAKEVVVSTMGTIYVPAAAATPSTNRVPTFVEDLADTGKGFVFAIGNAVANFFTFGSSTLNTKADPDNDSLRARLYRAFTPLSAYSFMVFVLLYMPCLALFVAMKDELKTWKWSFIALGYELILAWLMSFVIYQGGRLLGFV